MTRQIRRTMGRMLKAEMAGRIVCPNPIDYGRSASMFLGERRPHSCWRNALKALHSAPWATGETVYVEGWLIYDLARPDPMAHGWLEHAGKVVDGTLVLLARQLRDEYPLLLIRLSYEPVAQWTKAEHLATLEHGIDAGIVNEVLPMTPELQCAIAVDEHRNPAHFERIRRRQYDFDAGG